MSVSPIRRGHSPAEIVREIENLRARAVALQRKIDSSATGINHADMLAERRRRADEVRSTDRLLTEAIHEERESHTAEQRQINAQMRATWTESRQAALRKYEEHRKEIHNRVAEEERLVQQLAKQREQEELMMKHDKANKVRATMQRTVQLQREHVLEEARLRNKEEAAVTKAKLEQYKRDVDLDKAQFQRRRDASRHVRNDLAAQAKEKIERQRAEFQGQEKELQQRLAEAKACDEERRRAVSARAQQRREERLRRVKEAEQRISAQRHNEAQRIKRQVAAEIAAAREAKQRERDAVASICHQEEASMVSNIKQRTESERRAKAELAARMRGYLRAANERRAQSDSAATVARGKQLAEDASASREQYRREAERKLADAVTTSKKQSEALLSEVERQRLADAERKRRQAELLRKEQGQAAAVVKRRRHVDPQQVDHSSREQWEQAKRSRAESQAQLREMINKQREEQRRVHERLAAELGAVAEQRREAVRTERYTLLQTLNERKREFERQLAEVEAAAAKSEASRKLVRSNSAGASTTSSATRLRASTSSRGAGGAAGDGAAPQQQQQQQHLSPRARSSE